LFLKLRLPRWLRDRLRPLLEPVIRNLLFMRFIRQDIEMIESEYNNYLSDPDRRYVEVNPAIIAVQRLMVGQYDKSSTMSNGHDSRSSGELGLAGQTA
jgi:hypothetical protein